MIRVSSICLVMSDVASLVDPKLDPDVAAQFGSCPGFRTLSEFGSMPPLHPATLEVMEVYSWKNPRNCTIFMAFSSRLRVPEAILWLSNSFSITHTPVQTG